MYGHNDQDDRNDAYSEFCPPTSIYSPCAETISASTLTQTIDTIDVLIVMDEPHESVPSLKMNQFRAADTIYRFMECYKPLTTPPTTPPTPHGGPNIYFCHGCEMEKNLREKFVRSLIWCSEGIDYKQHFLFPNRQQKQQKHEAAAGEEASSFRWPDVILLCMTHGAKFVADTIKTSATEGRHGTIQNTVNIGWMECDPFFTPSFTSKNSTAAASVSGRSFDSDRCYEVLFDVMFETIQSLDSDQDPKEIFYGKVRRSRILRDSVRELGWIPFHPQQRRYRAHREYTNDLIQFQYSGKWLFDEHPTSFLGKSSPQSRDETKHLNLLPVDVQKSNSLFGFVVDAFQRTDPVILSIEPPHGKGAQEFVVYQTERAQSIAFEVCCRFVFEPYVEIHHYSSSSGTETATPSTTTSSSNKKKNLLIWLHLCNHEHVATCFQNIASLQTEPNQVIVLLVTYSSYENMLQCQQKYKTLKQQGFLSKMPRFDPFHLEHDEHSAILEKENKIWRRDDEIYVTECQDFLRLRLAENATDMTYRYVDPIIAALRTLIPLSPSQPTMSFNVVKAVLIENGLALKIQCQSGKKSFEPFSIIFEKLLEMEKKTRQDLLKGTSLSFDFAHLAETFERKFCSSIYAQSNKELLTPHQMEQMTHLLSDSSHSPSSFNDGDVFFGHVRGVAGSGHLLVAFHCALRCLREDGGKRVALVCSNKAMGPQFANFIVEQMSMRALQRFYVVYFDDVKPASSRKRSTALSSNKKLRIVSYMDDANGTKWKAKKNWSEHVYLDLIIAYDGYKVFNNADLTAWVYQHLKKVHDCSMRCDLLALSEWSQRLPDLSPGFPFPTSPTKSIELKEVMENSARIAAAAMLYSTSPLEQNETRILLENMSTGPPVLYHLFDRRIHNSPIEHVYAAKIGEAFNEILSFQWFQGLTLDNRVAILVPNADFKKNLSSALEDIFRQVRVSHQRFRVIDANEGSSIRPSQSRRGADQESRIIVDTVENMDGLERLIVLGVGLDVSVSDDNQTANVEARSKIYRSMTSAAFLYYILNETVTGGWFEWLRLSNNYRGTFNLEGGLLQACGRSMDSTNQRNIFEPSELWTGPLFAETNVMNLKFLPLELDPLSEYLGAQTDIHQMIPATRFDESVRAVQTDVHQMIPGTKIDESVRAAQTDIHQMIPATRFDGVRAAQTDVHQMIAATRFDDSVRAAQTDIHQMIAATKFDEVVRRLESHNYPSTIKLQYQNIYANGAKRLAEALGKGRHYTAIQLGGNNLGDEGCQALVCGLQNNTCDLLSLYNNGISDTGVESLAKIVQQCGVKRLMLGGNQITNDGCWVMVDYVLRHKNCCLKELSFYDNGIRDFGGDSLCQIHEANPSLRLNVERNYLSNDVLGRIRDCFQG